MMKNKLLEKMFEMPRWEALINKAELKGIDKGELRQYCKPQVRAELYLRIKNNDLEFIPSRMVNIPKDIPGEFRTVFVGDTCERILCSLINDCLFELFPEMVHKSCTSYQKGISTGRVVKHLSKVLQTIEGNVIGARYDFHHYFDTVNREVIMSMFDTVEQKLGFKKGTEPVMNLLRKAWNNDWVFDLDGNLIQQYNGIRQGNACGSWLADVVLYELDEFMSTKYRFYCRYSDDLIVIHDDVEEITRDITSIVQKYGVSLNLKKTETLYKNKWFKFLGFNLKDNMITLSKSRVKSFQKEIENRTIKQRNITPRRALNQVNSYLYKGDGRYSWATSVLPIINVQKDIDVLNEFVLDTIRACYTHKTKIGGLGIVLYNSDYTILRGVGRNVTANRNKTPKEIEGFYSIRCMQKALLTRRAAYDTLVRSM
jgi:hypothetical protein